jgi:hypothetical protein
MQAEKRVTRTTGKDPVRRYRTGQKFQPLTRSALDGRTTAAKLYDRLVLNIQNDLGGADACSTIENTLIEAFAGAAVRVNDQNARMLSGEEVPIGEIALAISALVRAASRIGLKRVPRDVTPLTLQEIARQIENDRKDDDDDVIDAEAAK